MLEKRIEKLERLVAQLKEDKKKEKVSQDDEINIEYFSEPTKLYGVMEKHLQKLDVLTTVSQCMCMKMRMKVQR